MVVIRWRSFSEKHYADYGLQKYPGCFCKFFSFHHFLPPDMMISMILTITFIGIFIAVTSEIEYIANPVLISRRKSRIQFVTRIVGQPVVELPLANTANLMLFNDLLSQAL